MTAWREESLAHARDVSSLRVIEPDAPPHPAEGEGRSIVDRLRSQVLVGDAITELAPLEPLIDGWLDLDTLAVLFGRPGSGKTHTALDMALHVATGSWWHGHEVRAGSVLYGVAEGARGIGPRVAAWRQVNRYTGSLDRLRWLPVAVNLLRPDEARALAMIAEDLGPELIVVDTLARSMAGGDENAYRDMSQVIDALEGLRAACGACVLAVHHSGKDASAGSRGHSSLLGAVDTELEVKNAGDGIIALAPTKQKNHATDAMPMRFSLVPAADSVAIARYTGRSTPGDALTGKAQAALDALLAIDIPGGVTTSQWEETAVQNGLGRSTFFVHRKTLLDSGQVQNVGTDQRPRYSALTRGNDD